MAKEVRIKDWSVLSVRLHPQLVEFLKERVRISGRSFEAEAGCVIGEAMEAAEVPPAETDTPFQCRETLMGEKAECKDCGQLIWHHAKLWAERHVQATGHNVYVSLFFDMIDDEWLEKLTPERRAELDSVRDGDVARGIAQQILSGRTH
jgi:hypothetical protein